MLTKYQDGAVKLSGLAWGNATQGVPGRFVKVTADMKVSLTAADTDKGCGVLVNDPKQDEGADVVAVGMVRVEANEAIDDQDLVASHTDGTCKTAQTGDWVMGQAFSTCAADGDYVWVLVGVNQHTAA